MSRESVAKRLRAWADQLDPPKERPQVWRTKPPEVKPPAPVLEEVAAVTTAIQKPESTAWVDWPAYL